MNFVYKRFKKPHLQNPRSLKKFKAINEKKNQLIYLLESEIWKDLFPCLSSLS